MDCTDTSLDHAANIQYEVAALAVAEEISPDDAQSMIQTAYHELATQLALSTARDGPIHRAATSHSGARPAEDEHSATLSTVADSVDLDMCSAEFLDSAPLGREPVAIAVAEQISPDRSVTNYISELYLYYVLDRVPRQLASGTRASGDSCSPAGFTGSQCCENFTNSDEVYFCTIFVLSFLLARRVRKWYQECRTAKTPCVFHLATSVKILHYIK